MAATRPGAKPGPYGTAGIVLAEGALRARSGDRIRRAMLEDDVVACVVALPPHLFRTTRIPSCLWILTKNKGRRRPVDRRGEILFVDAREAGTLVGGRTERVLTETDITRIAGTYHAWRGTLSARAERAPYRDEPGFCAAVGLEAVRRHKYELTPSRYVSRARAGFVTQDDRRGGLQALTRNLDVLFD
ncbi:N-6 DNA methylase [Streptomyces sp. NPDC127049]|uniref:N-6 DNA methylase n=1 Tax=Streptomyces sp. NPDC127049 TaxID=3347118 RepID=UPI003651C51F